MSLESVECSARVESVGHPAPCVARVASCSVIQAGNPWAENCNYLPQAEFFDQPFGGTIFVDNRHFPDSMNEVFKEGREEREREVSLLCSDLWGAFWTTGSLILLRIVGTNCTQLLVPCQTW